MSGKRILSFILALAMVLGMVPFNALDVFAAGDATSNTTPLVVDMLNGSISSGDLYNVLKGSSVFNAEPASGVAKEYGWTGSGVGLMNFPWGGDFRYGTEEYAVQGTELTSTSSGNANVESGVMYNAWRRSGKGQGTSGLYVGEYAGPKYFVPVACYDIKLDFASDMGSITINDVTVAGTTIKGGTYTYADHDGKTVRIYAGQTVTANSVADGEVNYTPSVATYTPSTSETLTITYSQDQGSITVNNFTHGSLDKNIAGKYAAGTKVTFTATPEAVNGGVGYYVSSITVDGTEQISNPDKSMRSFEVTVAVQKDTEHTVIVTFGKLELSGNATANVEFNPAKSAADQLDALKQEIFNKLMVNYVPDGVTYDQIAYEYKYYYIYTLNGNAIRTAQGDVYEFLGVDPADEDVMPGYYNNLPFGYLGLGTIEHVRLTYNGLSIEADVTLVHHHSWDSGVVTAPTCTDDGYTTFTCEVCGNTQTDNTVITTGHSYSGVVTAPTCTEGGYTTYTCSKCGDSYTADETEAAGHSYGKVVTAPTCTEDGYTTYTCSKCGHSYTDDKVATKGHTYDDGVVTTDPECEKVGVKTFTCHCGHSYTEDVAATGHTEATRREDVVSAGCGQGGTYTLVTYCGVCGEVLKSEGNQEIPATGAHTGGEPVRENVVDATCTKDGSYESVVYCVSCGTEISREKDQVIPATGHTYDAGVVTTNPGCESVGVKTFTCHCGHSYTEDVAATGHSYSGVVTAPTCTEGGYTTYTCSKCGDSYTADETEAAGHSYGKVVTAPTCTEDGYTTYTCSKCGHSYTGDPVGKLNHNFTYTNNGDTHTVTCTRGDYTKTGVAHEFVDYVCVCGELNANDGNVYVNLSVSDASSHFAALREKVLTAAGLPVADKYVVTTVLDLGDILGQSTLQINKDGSITVLGVNEYLQGLANSLAPTALALIFDEGKTQEFVIADTSANVAKTVTHTIKDSRLVLNITTADLSVSGKTEPADLMAQIKNKITITATNPETGAVTNLTVEDGYISIADYAWPADGQTGTFTVTVSIAPLGNDTYQAYANKTLTLTCVDTTILYNITWDINGDKQTVQVAENTVPTAPTATREYYTFDGWDKTVVKATVDTTYTATWTPVLDVNGNDIADQEEKYTIVYDFNDGVNANHVVFNVAWNAATPTISAPIHPTNSALYFAGWDVNGDGVVDVVAANVAAPTSGNTITYTAVWSNKCTVTIVYGNGTADGSQLVVPGGTITLDDATWDADHDFLGWYNGDTKVTFPLTVTENVTLTAEWRLDVDHDDVQDGSQNDPYYTVIVDNATVSTTALNGEYATPADPADRTNMFFIEWTKVVDNENHTITFTSVWNTNDTNDNNVDDEDETITVNAGDGTVQFNNVTVGNGEFIFNSTPANNNYTVVITPAAGKYISSLKVNGVEVVITNSRAYTGSYSNGVLTLTGVSLNDGDVIDVTYAEHKILADGDGKVPVNGYAGSTIFETLTKENVLEAILGTHYDANKIDEYTLEMVVGTAAIKDKLDDSIVTSWIAALLPDTLDINIFNKDEVIAKYPSLADVYDSVVIPVIKEALDINETEVFTLTWDSSDETKPVVKAQYEVALYDGRDFADAWLKDGKGTYNASEFNGALLNLIKNDLEFNGNAVTMVGFKNAPTTVEQGATYNVIVIVKVDGTETLQTNPNVEIAVTVTVPVVNASITIPGAAEMIYNTSMGNATLNSMVITALNANGGITFVPTDLVNVDTVVWYLARPEGTVPVRIQYTGMNGLINIDETIDVPVSEAWLNIGDAFPDVGKAPSQAELEALVDKMIDIYGLGLLDMSEDELLDIFMAQINNYPEIKKYIQYIGYHQFGYNDQVDAKGFVVETVKLTQEDTGYGALTSNTAEISLNDERYETYITLTEGVHVTYGFTAEKLLEKLAGKIYAKTENGDVLVNGVIELVTDIEGMNATDENGVEITVRYAGDDKNKFCTATVTIVIDKAAVDVTVDSSVIRVDQVDWTKNWPVTTNPSGVAKIEFVVGLDIADLNVDTSEGASISAIKGIVGKVQLLLPEDLQDLLIMAGDALNAAAGTNLSFADGATMKLSELKTAISKMEEVFSNYTDNQQYKEYFGVLMNMLNSLPTETADVEITIGGLLPTDIGVYVIGAVTADANYTTDFGVGAVVIYPDGTKVDLAWNQNDDNYIITNTLLTTKGADGKYLFDTGATAFERDTNYTVVDSAATEQVAEIFLGVDIDGNITIEMDQTKLNVGAFIEVAMTVDWGNSMYYSVPIVRPIVVVAESLVVDFVDENGNVNNERHYEFFNVPQNGMEGNLLVTYKKDGNGYKAGDKVTGYAVKYFYVGVQTNGKPYASTNAPVHAGVYTITAVVTKRDASGTITHAGQGIGALVIEPSKSTTDVENEAIKWDGQPHTFNQYVTVGSVNVPTLIPDKTVITVGISADLDANIGLEAIEGTFNVDLPAWMDNLMKKLGILEAGYTGNGITVTEFKGYVEKLEKAIADLGVETKSFGKIVDVINQLSDNATLTFHDDKGYTDVGAYLVIGIVTDSDHWPSADAGIVVIYPDAEKAELEYVKTWDDNNVFTWNVLQHYDLNAQAYLKGEFSQELTDKTLNLFVGFADHGELILTKNKAELDNGVYAEVSFLLVLDNMMYYAEPIAREVIIVPNPANVDFLDDAGNVNNERHFQFFNKPWAMDKLLVTLADGTELTLTVGDERVDIFYVGVQLNGKPYASAEAPVHAGVYEVTAQYTERKDGKVYNLGIGVGVLVIEPSKSQTTVDNAAYPYAENVQHHVNDLVHASSVNVPTIIPDTTVISVGLSANLDTISGLSSIYGNVNVDLPAWLDQVMKKLGILEAGYADGISRETFLSYVADIKAALTELGIATDSIDEITNVVNQLPINTNLTFQDNIGYTNPGAYLVIGIVTDSDHWPSVGAGIMVIYPDATKAELQFEEDWNDNNIFTWSALKDMNLEAQAFVNGVYSDEATKHVTNLYVGFTSDGTVMLEAVSYGEHVKDLPEFKNGAYSQIAVLLDLGNEMYYAKPISRAFLIVPTPANIEFVGDHEFVFDNKPHAMGVMVTINGVEVTDLSGLTLHYAGVMTNGQTYNSNEAPTHTGAYVVTATYTERDDLGRLNTLDVELGVMVIKPAKAEIDVINKTHEFDGNDVFVQNMITATSPVAGLTPDTIVITAGIKANGILDGNLLNAINNTVNIDLPDWADNLLAQVNGTEDGITVAGVLNAIEAVEAKIEELAAEAEVTVDVHAFDGLKKILAQMDPTFTVTFNENVSYKDVGAYLAIGIVADANHLPAMDAGVLVIYPDVDEAELHWKYVDSNNIFTLDTLAHVDLGAYATLNGAQSDAVPFQVLYLGVNANTMEIVLTRDQADLGVGNYTEFVYVLDIGSQMYVAEPIVRNLTIVQNMYEVKVEDATYTYDGTGKIIEMIAALNQAGQDISANGQVFVNYMGLTYGLDGYMSQTAPVNAGQYKAVVTFLTYDENGYLTGAGAKVVDLTINRADPDFDVQDAEFIFDGNQKEHGLLNAQDVDYIAVVQTEAGVNLVMTPGLQKLADYLDDKATYDLSELKEAIEKAIEVVDGLELESEFVNKVLETIEEVNDSVIYKITVNGANPVDAGTYKAYAITVPTANYDLDVSQGALVIKPKAVTIVVDNKTMTAGDALPELTYTIEGLVNGDSMTVDVTTEADGSVVGTYDITATYVFDPNYIVTVKNGTLTVEAQVVREIIDNSRTLSLIGEVFINQYVAFVGYDDIDLETNGGMLVWNHAVTEADAIYGTEDDLHEGLFAEGNEYYQQTRGFAAAEYADTIWIRIYVRMPDGSYEYGPLKEFSVREYCETIIEKRPDGNELKNTCIALLHYGAAAQEYFDYNLGDLANKNIVADYPVVDMNSEWINNLDSFTTNITSSNSVKHTGKTLSLDSATLINYYFTFAGNAKSAELLFWDGVNEELTLGNVSYNMALEYIAEDEEYLAQSDIFPGALYGKTIYACAHFVDENGEHHYSDVIAFSPEEYARIRIGNSSNAELVEVLKRMVTFGENARIYFD